jgi:hypothetical protein
MTISHKLMYPQSKTVLNGGQIGAKGRHVLIPLFENTEDRVTNEYLAAISFIHNSLRFINSSTCQVTAAIDVHEQVVPVRIDANSDLKPQTFIFELCVVAVQSLKDAKGNLHLDIVGVGL